MELLRAWGLGGRSWPAATTSSGSCSMAETLAERGEGDAVRGRLPDRGAEPAAEPDGAGLRAAGPPRDRAARAPADAAGRRRPARRDLVVCAPSPAATLVHPAPTRLTGRRGASMPVTSSAPTGPAARSARRLGIEMRGPGPLAEDATRSCSTRRCGSSSARTATASTASTTLEAPGTFLPAGRGDRWVLRRPQRPTDPTPTRPRTPADASSSGSALGAGSRTSIAPRITVGGFPVRRRRSRPLPPRRRLPHRRRRAPRHPTRRDRHEHRDRRRLRPRLEARVGAARLGGAVAPRHLRGRAADRRGAPRGALDRSAGQPTASRRRDAGRPRRSHPPRLAARAPTAARTSTLDLVGPGLTLHAEATGQRLPSCPGLSAPTAVHRLDP